TITSSGQILFCGKDVATALGYANTKDALARHCKGVVNHYPLETAGGVQQVRFISEGDLYRLIVTSKLPA
ncbi:Bro-N domain-containing protein, partial [Barnesiella sp. GGCC_0306]|nr:Bro-N domain-containing protein [Barnesiella sp. GGCC_0306]